MTEDLFRTEIERMHRLRRAIRGLDDAGRDAFIRELTESGAGAPDDWLLTAPDAQLPPLGDWSVWLFLNTAVPAGIGRIHYVGPTTSGSHPRRPWPDRFKPPIPLWSLVADCPFETI
jgi:hypothetical protein